MAAAKKVQMSYATYYTIRFFNEDIAILSSKDRKIVESLFDHYKLMVKHHGFSIPRAKKEIEEKISLWGITGEFNNDVFDSCTSFTETDLNQDIHKKKSVTHYYDHSKGIDLKKYPAYYISRVDGDLLFKSNLHKFFSKVTNKWAVTFITESKKIERLMSWEDFSGTFTYYDHSHPQYKEILENLQTDIRNKMTAEEFFNQRQQKYGYNRNDRKYSLDWNSTYDLVSDPGFSSALLKNHTHTHDEHFTDNF